MSFKLSRPMYLDTDDTCEEVSISRRQLAYWVEQSLIDPELGKDAKKYTDRDVRHLMYLRKLIVDYQLPVQFVKGLITSNSISDQGSLGALIESVTVLSGDADSLDDKVFDFCSRKVMSREAVGEAQLAQFVAQRDQAEIAQLFLSIALVLFRLMRINYPNPGELSHQYESLIDVLRHYAKVARVNLVIEDEPEPHVIQAYVDPILDGEEAVIPLESLAFWFWPAVSNLERFRKALTADPALMDSSDNGARIRFWSESELQAAERDYLRTRGKMYTATQEQDPAAIKQLADQNEIEVESTRNTPQSEVSQSMAIEQPT